MSSNDSVYLVTLKYTNKLLGSGSMIAQLGVDPRHQAVSGRADGEFLEGTQNPPQFSASVDGGYHSTGLGKVTRVGLAKGQAVVSFPPPAIGSYLTPFSMSFAVDNSWNGTGSFTIDGHTYEDCTVTSVG